MTKKKIAVVGAGIGGVTTALTLLTYGKIYGLFDICDESIDLYYDSTKPIERVGQGSTIPFNNLFFPSVTLNVDTGYKIATDFLTNKIGLTMKTGINYEGWGNCENFFHYFPLGTHAVHYQPNLLSKALVSSDIVNAIDTDVSDLSNIQADYIVDCRGRHLNDYENDYDMLVNPINSALISRKEGKDTELHYTRCVATPDGWTFVIPNIDSVSYGYLYNNTITKKEDAVKTFKKMFDVDVNFDLQFKNYVAKNFMVGDNIFLNGNRYCFLEPLEATSVANYMFVAWGVIDYIRGAASKTQINKEIRNEIKKVETFILWHYQNGSKYDTPFWEYAKSLPFNPNKEFLRYLEADTYISDKKEYAQWNNFNFKVWNDYVIKGKLD